MYGYGTREQVPENLFHPPSTTRPTKIEFFPSSGVLACWEHRKLSLPLDTFVALFIHHVLDLIFFPSFHPPLNISGFIAALPTNQVIDPTQQQPRRHSSNYFTEKEHPTSHEGAPCHSMAWMPQISMRPINPPWPREEAGTNFP